MKIGIVGSGFVEATAGYGLVMQVLVARSCSWITIPIVRRQKQTT